MPLKLRDELKDAAEPFYPADECPMWFVATEKDYEVDTETAMWDIKAASGDRDAINQIKQGLREMVDERIEYAQGLILALKEEEKKPHEQHVVKGLGIFIRTMNDAHMKRVLGGAIRFEGFDLPGTSSGQPRPAEFAR